MTSLNPKGARVIVKPYPSDNGEAPSHGKVLAVGPGRVLECGAQIPVDAAVGDDILFSKYAGTELVHNGETILVVDEECIYARVGE